MGFDLKKIKVNLSFVLVYLREGGRKLTRKSARFVLRY